VYARLYRLQFAQEVLHQEEAKQQEIKASGG